MKNYNTDKNMHLLRILFFIFSLLIINNDTVFGFPSRDVSERQVPFSKGVSFTGWFEEIPKSAREVHNKYSEQDFVDVKKLGIDVIRIPIDLFLFTSGTPDYKVDPLLFELLDQAVDYAEKHQQYVILDCHPEKQPVINRGIRDFLLPVWSQIAEHFKNRSEYVIYEILNEPQGISSKDWGSIQGDVINAIRVIDKNHWIVVGGVDYNSIEALSSLPRYKDNKLLYTFHFYEPYLFTHQGVTLLENLAGVPFPYDRNNMPVTPNDLKGTWVERYLKLNYFLKGTRRELARMLNKASSFSKQRNVPVFCGEFGVLLRYSPINDRVRWHEYVRELLEERNIPWIKWSYYDCFGMFNSQLDGVFRWASSGDINMDLDIELVRALGLTPVPQRQREQLQSSITIFDDNFGRGVRISYRKQNTINMYYNPAAEGRYAIHLGDLKRGDERSDGLTLLLSVMDLTYLAQNGYVLEFKAKADKPIPFAVIFYNFQDNINWQLGYMIDHMQIPPDGEWHTIRIPLYDMRIWGGIDITTDQYIESRVKPVSWAKINMLEFISVQEDDGVYDLYLDSIKITQYPQY